MKASYGCGIYWFDACFMDLYVIIGTYIAGRGRLGNVVSGWTTIHLAKVRKFYKRRKEMDIREGSIFY